jgi:hypothetical protein
VALLLAKSLADFSQSQAKTKVVCTDHTKHGKYGTAESQRNPVQRLTAIVRLLCSKFNASTNNNPTGPRSTSTLMYKQLCQMKCSAYPKEMFWTGSGSGFG